MGIINIQNGDVTPTVSQKQTIKKALIIGQINSSFQELVTEYTALFNEIWTSNDLNPQEVMDAFGADAGSLLAVLETLKTGVNTIAPETITLTPPVSYTVEENGSVTIHN